MACCTVAALSFPLGAAAQCRAGATSALAMPTVSWLRAWTGPLAVPARIDRETGAAIVIADPARGRLVRRGDDGALLGQIATGGRPSAVAADPVGGYWVGDAEAGSVTRYDERGEPRFALGVGPGEFGQPGDILVDAGDGSVYVSDAARHRVVVYSSAGLRLRTIGSAAPADDSPPAPGTFRTPTGMAIAGDELLVGDALNFRVQAFDKQSGAYRYCLGTFRASSFFSPNSGPARTFGMVQGLSVDALGRLYVADAFQGQVVVVDRGTGAVIGRIGAFGDAPGALRGPSDALIDGQGRLIVANADHGRLEIYGLDGFADPEAFVPASARLDPLRLDRRAPPVSVTLALEVPGHRAIDIDAAAVTANGVPAQALEVTDRDGNGTPELRLALPASELLATLDDGEAVPVAVAGPLGPLTLSATALLQVSGAAAGGDRDGDGIDDFADRCPDTAAGAVVDRHGCAIAQRCRCEAADGKSKDRDHAQGKGHGRDDSRGSEPQRDNDLRHGDLRHEHGAYVRCVEQAAAELRHAGTITQQDFRVLVREAAQSSCRRPR